MTPLSSLIQTLLSVPESHRFMPCRMALLADCTAGREFHPAPKTQTVYTRSGQMSIARREFPAGKFAHPASASRSPPGRTRPLRRLCRPQRSPERGTLASDQPPRDRRRAPECPASRGRDAGHECAPGAAPPARLGAAFGGAMQACLRPLLAGDSRLTSFFRCRLPRRYPPRKNFSTFFKNPLTSLV